MNQADKLAILFEQVTLAIAQGRKQSIHSAVIECIDRCGFDKSETYQIGRAGISLHYQIFGKYELEYLGQPTYGKCWLNPESRSFLIMLSMMTYEYIVQEMLGSRVENPPIVTRCNTVKVRSNMCTSGRH